MRWLKVVSVLVLRVRGLLGTARPTQAAGRVNPERMTLVGSLPFVRGTKRPLSSRQRLQLAKQASKHAKMAALQIKAAARPTPAKAPAQTPTDSQSLVRGN
jgi:hypothetical protein